MYYGSLKFRREFLWVQFADEELRKLLSVFRLCIRAAGHLYALQGIDAVQRIAKRAQDTCNCFLSGRQICHPTKSNCAYGTVIMDDFPTITQAVLGITFCIRHTSQQV